MIYTLTVLKDHTDKRLVGLFLSKEKALEVVANSRYGLDECYFDHMVLESFPEGVNTLSESEDWFVWMDNGWTKSCKPPYFAGLCNFAH